MDSTDESATAEAFGSAVARLCDHYDVDVDSKYVHLDGPVNRVHYLTAGEGPPLLLVHGLGGTAADWVPAFDVLTDRFTVYALDRPGRGLSTPIDYRTVDLREFCVDYLAAFLDGVGVERTAVVANSLGGYQAIAMAADRPARVDRLCALGGAAGLTREIPLSLRLYAVPVLRRFLFERTLPGSVDEARDLSRKLNVVDDSSIPDVYYETAVLGERLPGRRESLWSQVLVLVSPRGASPAVDLRPDLDDVGAPTRFVWGREDFFWQPSVARAALDAMPDAELIVLDDHGHVPWLEPGDAAMEATVEFLVDE